MRDRIAVQAKDKENHNQHHTMVTAKIQGRGQNKETKRVKRERTGSCGDKGNML